MLYHAVAVLSYRSKHGEPPRNSSISYKRQGLSSSQILSALSNGKHSYIIMFHFVPYAASLSLSVAYREMRHSKIPIQRAHARDRFQSCCGIPQRLSGSFLSAFTMAQMSTATLQELDRVLSSVARVEQQSLGVQNPCTGGSKRHSINENSGATARVAVEQGMVFKFKLEEDDTENYQVILSTRVTWVET